MLSAADMPAWLRRWVAHRPAEFWYSTALTGLLLPALVALGAALWRTPFGISESVALLDDVERTPVLSHFDLTAPYFRPLFYAALSGVLHAAGSIEAALPLYTLLHAGTVVLLILLLAWHLPVRTPGGLAAAAVAISVLVGARGFRDNLENLPLNQTMIIMLIAVVVWILLERERRAWSTPLIVGLVIVAIGFKEQGLAVAALAVAAAVVRSPGASPLMGATVGGLSLAYLGVRLAFSGDWEPFVQDIGFGFGNLSTGDAAERFHGVGLLAIYAYNVSATAANVLFSEPSRGVYGTVRALREGGAAPWQINELLSSAAVTALLAWGAFTTWRRPEPEAAPAARAYVAFAVTLAVSAALGFNYTRDRFGGVAVVFQALATFYACRSAISVAPGVPLVRRAALAVILLALAGAWQLRVGATMELERIRAWDIRREWMLDLPAVRANRTDAPNYLRIVERLTPQGTKPSPADIGIARRRVDAWLGEL